MNDVRKLFENWMKEEFDWELRRTMHLRHYDKPDEYVHVEVQKYYKAFKAAIKIMGEMK